MDNSEGYVRLALALLLDALRLARQGNKVEQEWLMTEGICLLRQLGVPVTRQDMEQAIKNKPKGGKRLWTH